MTQIVNIDLKYNSGTQSSEGFARTFRNDFEYCMKRFNVQLNFNEGSIATDNLSYQLIVVSSTDLNSTAFCESIKNSVKDETHTFLLVLDPIKAGNAVVSQQKLLSFSFWDQIVETGEVRYFRKESRETQHLYWERITDIAFELLGSASKLKENNGIYLAQTDDSQMQDRDNIKRDLSDLGYSVIPNTLLSNNYEESVSQINKALGDTSLIIHLIPATYTEYFANKSISVVEHQCNLSAKHIQRSTKNIYRIVWIPSDFDVVDDKNQIFIEKIQRDQDQSLNTLVLKVNLEDLKKIYRKILLGESVNIQDESNLPDLYVITDKHDDNVELELGMEAKATGLKFGINYKGITYNDHLKYLASAQVVVINYTHENQQWINVKVHDILKSPGLETSKPNKKLVLIKNSKELDTSHFEKYFNEVRVVRANEIKLNV